MLDQNSKGLLPAAEGRTTSVSGGSPAVRLNIQTASNHYKSAARAMLWRRCLIVEWRPSPSLRDKGHGVDPCTIDMDLKVQVVACGPAGAAHKGDNLALIHILAR